MMRVSHGVFRLVMVTALAALPIWASADGSSVGTFSSVVTTGPVKQTTSGSGNRQDLNVGSASATRANKFNSTVTTGPITQSSRGTGIVQSANIGSSDNSDVDSFTATVNAGKIEQVSTKSGDRQELDIGSVRNSTVNGAFKANVNVKDGVRQTGSGEVVLGSAKNSNVQSFSTNVDVKGTVTGSNIRIGSVVGGEQGNKSLLGVTEQQTNNNNSSFGMPGFSRGQDDGNQVKPIPKILPILGNVNYGCYCGKGYTGCGTNDYSVAPLDSMDRLCMEHDKAYGEAYKNKDTEALYKADLKLLSGLYALDLDTEKWNEVPKESDTANVYRAKAILLFSDKIAAYEANQFNNYVSPILSSPISETITIINEYANSVD